MAFEPNNQKSKKKQKSVHGVCKKCGKSHDQCVDGMEAAKRRQFNQAFLRFMED